MTELITPERPKYYYQNPRSLVFDWDGTISDKGKFSRPATSEVDEDGEQVNLHDAEQILDESIFDEIELETIDMMLDLALRGHKITIITARNLSFGPIATFLHNRLLNKAQEAGMVLEDGSFHPDYQLHAVDGALPPRLLALTSKLYIGISK